MFTACCPVRLSEGQYAWRDHHNRWLAWFGICTQSLRHLFHIWCISWWVQWSNPHTNSLGPTSIRHQFDINRVGLMFIRCCAHGLCYPGNYSVDLLFVVIFVVNLPNWNNVGCWNYNNSFYSMVWSEQPAATTGPCKHVLKRPLHSPTVTFWFGTVKPSGQKRCDIMFNVNALVTYTISSGDMLHVNHCPDFRNESMNQRLKSRKTELKWLQ